MLLIRGRFAALLEGDEPDVTATDVVPLLKEAGALVRIEFTLQLGDALDFSVDGFTHPASAWAHS